VPADERIEPFAFFADGQAVHAHARYGDGSDVLRIVNRGDGFPECSCTAAPDLFRLPYGPLGVRRIRVESFGRAAATGDDIPLSIVNDSLERRGAQIQPDKIVH